MIDLDEFMYQYMHDLDAYYPEAWAVIIEIVKELREARAQRTVLYGTERVAADRAKPEAGDNEVWARIAYAAYISEQQTEFGGFDFNEMREDIKDSWRRLSRDLLAMAGSSNLRR